MIPLLLTVSPWLQAELELELARCRGGGGVGGGGECGEVSSRQAALAADMVVSLQQVILYGQVGNVVLVVVVVVGGGGGGGGGEVEKEGVDV